MKALIDLTCYCERIDSYPEQTEYGHTRRNANWIRIPNSARICQIEEEEFDINPTNLLWVECNTSVDCHNWYYDKSDSTIKQIVNETPPAEE